MYSRKADPLTEKLKAIRRRGLMEKAQGLALDCDKELMEGRSLEVAAGPVAVAEIAACCDANNADEADNESVLGESAPALALEGVDTGCAECGKEPASDRPLVNVDHLNSVSDNVMILSDTVATLMARVDALEKSMQAQFAQVDKDMRDGGAKLDFRSLGSGGGGGGGAGFASLS